MKKVRLVFWRPYTIPKRHDVATSRKGLRKDIAGWGEAAKKIFYLEVEQKTALFVWLWPQWFDLMAMASLA